VVTRPKQSDQAKRDPNRGRDDRDAGENIAGLRAERTRTTHAAKSAGQAATATALHEHKQYQENCQER
jgi:hypothetical protein